MSSTEVRQATQLYAAGLSLADVGKRMGRSYSTIHKALKRAGVRMRDTHGRA
ncbi:helix-turn-helix domain-containing protein [Kribbella sp. NPDC051952]|uniref:helix-turn-helix domain-containing protein n=1 Tax=Kribbella sp. NPDC051952 TaxID=3154851 RepID=UPI0034221CD6